VFESIRDLFTLLVFVYFWFAFSSEIFELLRDYFVFDGVVMISLF
jgi:hypothetical protein